MAHLPLKKLLAFHYNQLNTAEKEDAQAHLDACDACEKNLTLLVKPEQLLKTKPASTGTRVTELSACPSAETLGKYINAELLPAEIPSVEKHLIHCESCRQQLLEISQTGIEPVGAEAQKTLTALPPTEITAHVNAIMRLLPTGPPAAKFIPKKERRLDRLIPGYRVPWPAYACVALLLIGAIGKKWVWPIYRYTSCVSQGEKQLLEQHKIHYLTELRPAGDYHSSDKSQAMSPEEDARGIEKLLQQALTYRPNGETALLRLAQYYLLKKQNAAADSILKILEKASPQNAAVRNARGCWFYQRGQYEAAATAFAAAFASNPRLDETLYNLAITQAQTGDTASAKISWGRYLQLNGIKPEWHNAAKARLQALK